MTLPANATRLPHTVSDQPFDPDAIYARWAHLDEMSSITDSISVVSGVPSTSASGRG